MLLPRLKFTTEPLLKLNSLQKDAKSQIEEKLREGVYSFETLSCPVCEIDQREIVGQKDRYGLSYVTNICSSCGIVYTNPRMDKLSYDEFYNNEYRKLYVGTTKPTSDFFNSQIQKGTRIYDFLKDHAQLDKKKLSILEVGCGAGGILWYFESKGHQVKGIDLGAEYINYGKKTHDLSLEVGTIENLHLSFDPDIIIYSHVFEHILDLNKELKLIKEIAKPNTLLYIEVPGIKYIHKNYRSDVLRYFQNAHTYHFSLESLMNIMSKNGFDLIIGNQKIQSIFRISDINFEIVNDFNSIKNYLLKTERKRKTYSFGITGLMEKSTKTILWLLDTTGTRKVAKKIKSKFS